MGEGVDASLSLLRSAGVAGGGGGGFRQSTPFQLIPRALHGLQELRCCWVELTLFVVSHPNRFSAASLILARILPNEPLQKGVSDPPECA